MTLTTGKRTKLEAEYQSEVNRWARAMNIPAPQVRVRRRIGGSYSIARGISVPPECSKETLVHEFAHHIADFKAEKRAGHGPHFRVALVQAATIAYGLATRYPRWVNEYDTVASWARRHGLVETPPRATTRPNSTTPLTP